jgi:hypothetical protein
MPHPLKEDGGTLEESKNAYPVLARDDAMMLD